MKLINLFFIVTIIFADIAICSIDDVDASPTHENHLEKYVTNIEESSSSDQIHDVEHFSLFLPRKNTRRLTCNRFPRICRAKGSPGPSCCKKQCVNLLRDRHNCGKCGKKCKYNKICCNGKCVNPSFNKRHCGGCNNRCSSGGLCAFGLCSYS